MRGEGLFGGADSYLYGVAARSSDFVFALLGEELGLVGSVTVLALFAIVGWRGFGGPPNDAPEHWIMGVKTPEILDLLGVPNVIMEPESLESDLDGLLAKIKRDSVPGALLVRSGMII